MICFVTSIGEPTTNLCTWSLQRNGFEVILLNSKDTLWYKLNHIYQFHDDFLRVDADVIVNQHLTPELLYYLARRKKVWWWQFVTFDWFKQDINHSMSYIKKEALPSLRANIGRFERSLRPETDVSRIKELHNPRRMETYNEQIMGLHGYKCDIASAKLIKEARGQDHLYDFELAEKLNKL